MANFEDIVNKERQKRASERQEKLAQETEREAQLTQMRIESLRLGKEVVSYLIEHNIPTIRLYKRSSLGMYVVPEREDYGLYGNCTTYPRHSEPRPAYEYVTTGWHLLGVDYPDDSTPYDDYKTTSLTAEGELVHEHLCKHGDTHTALLDEMITVDGEPWNYGDRVIDEGVEPSKAYEWYKNDRITNGVVDLLEQYEKE